MFAPRGPHSTSMEGGSTTCKDSKQHNQQVPPVTHLTRIGEENAQEEEGLNYCKSALQPIAKLDAKMPTCIFDQN